MTVGEVGAAATSTERGAPCAGIVQRSAFARSRTRAGQANGRRSAGCACTTFIANVAAGEPTFGIPKLKEILGEPVAGRLAEWLGLAPAGGSARNGLVIRLTTDLTAAAESAEQIRDDVYNGLAGFTDSFMDALSGDFLAETDERRLRDKYRNQPAVLAARLATNRRALGAQRALHVLYNKLLAGAAMTIEEQTLAEHARDLADGYAIREIEQRSSRTAR